MTFAPLTAADTVIQFHVACAMTAVILGPFALYGRRKNRVHKSVGYIWVVAMILVALSSFFIEGLAVFGVFGPIHLLSLFTLWSIFIAMRHVLAGRIVAHSMVMRNLYWYGVIIAGLFNFLPGRTVNRMVFNDARELGYVVIAAGMGVLVAHLIRQRMQVAPQPNGFRT